MQSGTWRPKQGLQFKLIGGLPHEGSSDRNAVAAWPRRALSARHHLLQARWWARAPLIAVARLHVDLRIDPIGDEVDRSIAVSHV